MRTPTCSIVRLALLAALTVATPGCSGAEDPGATAARASASSTTAPQSTVESDDTLPEVRLTRAFPSLDFDRPVWLTHAGDGSNRLFVLEQRGRIRVFPNDRKVSNSAVFLDLRSKVYMGHNEEGLLGLAFHPNYPDDDRLFVYYSAKKNDEKPRRGVLSSFRVSADDPNRADPDSERIILEFEQPWGNHNGATVLFGPDGFLYVSLGDGGAAADPHNHGQDLRTLLGSIIRIDIDRESDGRAYAVPEDNPFVGRTDARPEIWAYGLRNVWRMSFDEAGQLWAGDVGQNAVEEIDLIVKGGNYGWRIREGMREFRQEEYRGTLIEPVAEYPRSKGLSVTGGYVYRGTRVPALRGAYVYADYVSGIMWGLRHDGSEVTGLREIIKRGDGQHVTSFGEDESGELYVCAFDRIDGRRGRIFMFRAAE